MCVLINVCQFIGMCVCALVSKGWDRQWREQKLPVPEVRSVRQHDALPLSRTPAANTHRMVSLLQHHHQHPLLQLLIFTSKIHHLFASKYHPCAVKWPQHV